MITFKRPKTLASDLQHPKEVAFTVCEQEHEITGISDYLDNVLIISLEISARKGKPIES